jgi:hypothetical protein
VGLRGERRASVRGGPAGRRERRRADQEVVPLTLEYHEEDFGPGGPTYLARLVECPACGEDLEDATNRPTHIGQHDPEDFGLSPLVTKPEQQPPSLETTSDGYEYVRCRENGADDTAYIHRLCFVAWHGLDALPAGYHVHHDCSIGWLNIEDNPIEPGRQQLVAADPEDHAQHHLNDRDTIGNDREAADA